MKIYPFKAIYPNMNLVTSADQFFANVKFEYPELVKSGFFNRLEKEAIYIYEIKTPIKSYKAIIASNDLVEVDSKILKHEDTLAAKEQSMMQLVLQRNAMIKPVLLSYDGKKDINEFIDAEIKSTKPMLDIKFEDLGERHLVYAIDQPKKIGKLQELFINKVNKCYIADGHHRVTTTMLLAKGRQADQEQIDSLLSIYFTFDELDIYDYNRAVQIKGEISYAQLIVRLSKVFKIKEIHDAVKPDKKYQLTMLLGRHWYKLQWKKKVLKTYEDTGLILDTDLLNRYVLQNIMNIIDVRTDQKVSYIEGTLGTKGIENVCLGGGNRKVGFCLYPISKSELKYVAEKGINLPPKSTWFEPRIKNGIIVQDL